MWVAIVSCCLIAFYTAVRLRGELQMLQQNSYRPCRYFRWLRGDLASADRVTDWAMAVLVAAFWGGRWGLYALGAAGLLSLFKAVKMLGRRSKKPLVWTARAWRLYVVALVPGVGGAVILAPLALLAAWVLLWPIERLINGWYVRDARRRIAGMPDLIVVGITGSYGKTSTKHALARILAEKYSVVMTPGSYNTLLGVVRTIRENLRPYTEVFIVEMGAKSRGDIAEICRLVHPRIGILTSVGPQHLESFKTIGNVARAKFELVDALPADGVAVLNDDFEMIRNREVTNVGTVLRYTAEQALSQSFETRLVGRHNLSNILAASLVARSLGVSDERIRYAVAGLEPVPHRLEVTRRAGLTIIDDAFNSNPEGAAMALEVLAGSNGRGEPAETSGSDRAFLGEPRSSENGGRRIVVTPGMIELAARQEELNRELGRQMAASCDYAVVVGGHNREAIVGGLADGGFPADNIYEARDFAAATKWVHAFARAGDTILYENDLPDTFK